MDDYLVPFENWFQERNWPSPVGLSMGLGMVLVWQIVLIFYYMIRRESHKRFGYPVTIQKIGPQEKTLIDELWAHVSAPESFLMVFGYVRSKITITLANFQVI